jgi:hypothetical protein
MKNRRRLHLFIYPKISPIVGFILQKDVYTTNLLYANDKFPTKSLRKTIPFLKPSYMHKTNPDSCITILNEKRPKLEINDEILTNSKYPFKHKKLGNKRLKFPLPKMKTIPLRNSILQEEICKEDLKIKFLKDDSNIYSNSGKKLFYNLTSKENSTLNQNSNKNNRVFVFKKRNSIKLNFKNYLNHKKEEEIRKYKNSTKNNTSIGKNNINSLEKSTSDIRDEIYQINNDLKEIIYKEKERRKLFYRKDFFSTQIYNKINIK